MLEHRIVLAGCGNMANRWLDYVITRDNAEIVALVDISEDAARKKAEQYNLSVPVFTVLKDAILKTHPNLVLDVTIPAAHKDVVTQSLNHGCHVFGEKPMAENLEDAKEIVAVAEQTGKNYTVMQNRRFLPSIRSLRDWLNEGIIGKAHTYHADFFLGPHFGGFRDMMDSPLIVDMAIHTFDQARFISGANAKSVYCYEFNPEGSWYKGNASAVCIFEMDDGSVFTYRGSWCAEGFPTSWEGDWRIIGTKGTAKWDGVHLPTAEVVNKDEKGFFLPTEKVEAPLSWSGREEHDGCLDEMFSSIENDRLAETDCRDNLKSMEMVFAAIQSAKEGRKVYL
ncbi:Gfo/Idh/MocA family oxidoreductase [Gracilibacillus halotolerans]|uniref:Gfo/Idh/MocA family protein n=1 Tax=Gracilibacillus halotolerans TaxID=74386 RepID=UPI00161CC5EA|nr:Gfo/Idh/MocA family oxidoreductase [Gracilibacillus halotolerans]